METHTAKVELSYEHIGSDWLPYQRSMEKLTFKNAKDVLTKANEFLKTKGLIK
jgi:bis(5'-nucleosidyl)-tetraphosphatase